MEDIIDSVRRIIAHWVNTTSPLRTDANIGDTIIHVDASTRFKVNDEIMVRSQERYETGLNVKSIVDETHIELSSPIKFLWRVSENSSIIKTINEMYVQGIYFGDPNVIPAYPAISVSGEDKSSEWMTLDSTKERYNININIYVEDATEESGYRFLLKVTDIIEKGLKENVFPLVNDYNTYGITEDIAVGDRYIKLSSTTDLVRGQMVFIEDAYKSEQAFISEIVDSEVVGLTRDLCFSYNEADSPIAIFPNRLIFNSWAERTNFMKIHKDVLLKAAVINWFAEEEEVQLLKKFDPHLK